MHYPLKTTRHLGLTLLALATMAGPAGAQQAPELTVSSGFTLTHLAMQRQSVSRSFRTGTDPALAATARLLLPVRPGWGLEAQVRLAGLAPVLTYRERGRYYHASSSHGLSPAGVVQVGVGVRRLDLLPLGPKFGLEAAAHASYARVVPAFTNRTGQLGTAGGSQPQASWEQRQQHRGTPMLGLEVALRYEFNARNYLLLALAYQYGLRHLAEIRSLQVAQGGVNGQPRTGGSFVVPMRGSYSAVQFGYGWLLTPAEGRSTRWRTPRYHVAPSPPDDAPVTEI